MVTLSLSLLLCGAAVTTWMSSPERSVRQTLTTIGMLGLPVAFLINALAVRVESQSFKRWVFRAAWLLAIIGVISFGISNTDDNHSTESVPFFG